MSSDAKEIIMDKNPENKIIENNLTISTKLSTDQLICKSPQESPSISVVSLKEDKVKKKPDEEKCPNALIFYLGSLQLFFGVFMLIFGVLVILHGASLARSGSGIWGGVLAISTGLCGILATSKKVCPLKPTAQKLVHTIFLALSLISIAISQLVVVLSATGLARDVSQAGDGQYRPQDEEGNKNVEIRTFDHGKITIILPTNYHSLLYNICLLTFASLECIFAAISAYKSARLICPCFQKPNKNYPHNLNINNNNSHALVSSWLGKHNVNVIGAPHVYVAVAAPSSNLSSRKSATPIYAIRPPSIMHPPMIRYPLIPAPLGAIPSPIIPPPLSKRELMYRKYRQRAREPTPRRSKSRSRSRSSTKERSVMSEQDMARTYTGLDRTIAEEFIDMCESRHASLSSDFSTSTSNSSSSATSCPSSPCDVTGGSDAASSDFLVTHKSH